MSKIFGWALLLGGVLIIAWSLYNSFNIFTGKKAVPEIIKVPVSAGAAAPAGINLPGVNLPVNLNNIQQELGKMLGEQLKGILPLDSLPKVLNLTIWSMLSGLFIFGGGQLASLGIKLIKQ